jgi:hypothetical protein
MCAMATSSSRAESFAAYYKPDGQPQLILRRRSQIDDHELLARAWHVANEEACQLGWIV